MQDRQASGGLEVANRAGKAEQVVCQVDDGSDEVSWVRADRQLRHDAQISGRDGLGRRLERVKAAEADKATKFGGIESRQQRKHGEGGRCVLDCGKMEQEVWDAGAEDAGDTADDGA